MQMFVFVSFRYTVASRSQNDWSGEHWPHS